MASKKNGVTTAFLITSNQRNSPDHPFTNNILLFSRQMLSNIYAKQNTRRNGTAPNHFSVRSNSTSGLATTTSNVMTKKITNTAAYGKCRPAAFGKCQPAPQAAFGESPFGKY